MPIVGEHVIFAELSYAAMGAAIAVHQELGPGLLERVYHAALEIELGDRGLEFESKVSIPVSYRGRSLGFGYEADLVVGGKLVMELKSVERLLPVHSAQALTYMRLLECPVGCVVNFNVPNLMQHGHRRLVL